MTCENNCLHYEACLPFYDDIKMELCNSFQDKSQIIKLPCACDSIVYKVVNDKRIKNPIECKVIGFWYTSKIECCNVHLAHYVNGIFESSFSVPFTEFGKTIFLKESDAYKFIKNRN